MSKQFEALVLEIAKLENAKRGMRIQAVRAWVAQQDVVQERYETPPMGPKPVYVAPVFQKKAAWATMTTMVDKLEAELTKAIRIEDRIDDLLDQIEAKIAATYPL